MAATFGDTATVVEAQEVAAAAAVAVVDEATITTTTTAIATTATTPMVAAAAVVAPALHQVLAPVMLQVRRRVSPNPLLVLRMC